MGQMVSLLIGSIAGVLRIAPYVTGQLVSSKKMASYQATSDLGVDILQQHRSDIAASDFEDMYLVNPKDGCKLHAVVDSGAKRVKGKRPMVFVHGFPEMWISWIDQLKYYANKGHPVLALDMRGYGLSDKPQGLENYNALDSVLEDVQTAITFMSKENPSLPPLLIGHDWGASVCWGYACQEKTKKDGEIAGYVSLTIPPLELFEAKMSLKQLYASLYMFFFNAPWLPEATLLCNNAWLIGRMMNSTTRAVLPNWMTNAYRSNCLQPGAMTAQLNYYRYMIQKTPKKHPSDVLGPNKKLQLPTLMIRGKDDEALTGDVFEGWQDYLAHGRLVALDDCSHWVQADAPDTVHQEIDKLLDEPAK